MFSAPIAFPSSTSKDLTTASSFLNVTVCFVVAAASTVKLASTGSAKSTSTEPSVP